LDFPPSLTANARRLSRRETEHRYLRESLKRLGRATPPQVWGHIERNLEWNLDNLKENIAFEIDFIKTFVLEDWRKSKK
jgi:hypothetical protein